MSDLTAAVEAAELRMWPAHHEPDELIAARFRAAVIAACEEIEAAARADERAKTAEGIARALLAVDPIEWALAGQGAGEDAAAIARQHAGNRPQDAPDAISAPAESDRTPEGAQTRSGRKPGGPVLPARPRLYDPAVDGPIEFPKSST